MKLAVFLSAVVSVVFFLLHSLCKTHPDPVGLPRGRQSGERPRGERPG